MDIINEFYILITLENARPFIYAFLQALVEIQSMGGFDQSFYLFAELIEKNPDLKSTYDALVAINTDTSGLRTKIRIGLFLLNDRASLFIPLKSLDKDAIKASCKFLDEDFTFSKLMFNDENQVFEILYEELLNLKKILNKK